MRDGPVWGGGSARMASADRCRSRSMTIVLAAAAMMAIDMASGAWLQPLRAQQAQGVSLAVAPMTHAAAASETQLPIVVEPKATLPGNSFLRVSGLPFVVALSDGYATAPGSWFVPLSAGANLRVIVPVGAQGNSDVEISVVNREGRVFAQARTVLMIMPATRLAAANRELITNAVPPRDLDPSPLDAMHKGFDRFIARRGAGAKGKSPTAEERAEMFRTFLTWPQNPLEVVAVVRFTTASGVGDVVGTLTVKNSEILVAGRKEAALFIKPNLRGLSPGSYAFHVHENPSCGPAMKDGQPIPGMAAGTHLWLSGTGTLSGTTFTSHLGDLPKLQVDGDGTATKTVVAARLTLADVADRSFMIHATQDDNSARLACAPFH
jgi:superoxide dismutase, Cu-Zn family